MSDVRFVWVGCVAEGTRLEGRLIAVDKIISVSPPYESNNNTAIVHMIEGQTFSISGKSYRTLLTALDCYVEDLSK